MGDQGITQSKPEHPPLMGGVLAWGSRILGAYALYSLYELGTDAAEKGFDGTSKAIIFGTGFLAGTFATIDIAGIRNRQIQRNQ